MGAPRTLHETYLMHLTAQYVNKALAAERDWQASAGEPVPQRSAAGARGRGKIRYVGKLKS